MARDTSPDKIQLQVVIDGSPARKELAETTQAMVKLKQEQKALGEQERQLMDARKAARKTGDIAEVQRLTKELNTVRDAYDKVSASIKENTARQSELRNGMDLTELSLAELRKKAQELRAAWSAGVGNTEQLTQIGQELQLVEQRMQALGTQQGRSLMLWEQGRKEMDLSRMSLAELAMEQRRYQTLLDASKPDTEQYKAAAEGLAQVKDRQDQLTNAKRQAQEQWENERKNIALVDMTLEQLELEYQRAAAARATAKPGAEYDQAAAQLDAVKQRQEALTNAKLRAADAWENERKGIALVDMTLEQLELEYKRAEQIREQAKPGGEYEQAQSELLAVKDRMEQLTNETRRTQDQWAQLRKTMTIDQMSIEQLKLEKQYLEQLRASVDRTGTEYSQLTRELQETERALGASRTGVDVAEREWEQLRRTLQLNDMTMEQLEAETRRLNNILRTTDPNTAEWAAYRRELTAVEARTKTLTSGLGPFGRMWQEIRGNVLSAGAVLGGMFAGQAVFTGISNMIRSSAQLSDAISDVRKTTGLSTPVVKELASTLSTIDTRTSRAELLALARDAGKLGITGKQDILEFVRAGNQINVALGEDLGKDAIKSIGKLVDLFDLKKRFGLEDSILKVGSTLNELGMASTAAEGYMVEFLRRMGGIAPLANITIDQTLALGATLDSLGQTSEVSSTALSKMFVKMASEAEQYAQIAGMSTERFRRLMQKNALEAFIAVLEGSKATKGGIIALTETLGDLGVDGSRAAGVFGVLSSNTARLREQMGIANRAFREGSSVTEEYNEKNNNLAATLEKLQKEFHRLLANNTVMEFFTGLAVSAREAIDWLERNKDAFIIFGKALLNVGVAWGSYKLATALATKASLVAVGVSKALAVAKGVLTGKISLATAAMRAWNTVSKLNVFGLLISSLTTLVSLWGSFSSSLKEAADQMAVEATKLRLLHAEIIVTNADTEKRKKLIEELKAAYPDYLANLDSDTASNEELGRAVEHVNQQLLNKAVLQMKDKELEEQLQRTAAKKLEQMEREMALRKLLVDLSQKSGVKLKESNNVLEQALDFQRRVSVGQLGGFSASELDRQIVGLKAYQNEVKGLAEEQNTILQARTWLAQQLGLETQFVTDAQKEQNDAVEEGADKMEKQLRTLKAINEEIKSLEDQRELVDTRAKYDAITAKIKALEAERNAITGSVNKAQTAKQLENLDKLEQEYRAFIARMKGETLDADAKELAALDAKHAEELLKVKEQQEKLIAAKLLKPRQAKADLKATADGQAQERADLIDQQGNRRLEAVAKRNAEIEALLRDGRNTTLSIELETIDEEISMRQTANQSVVELEQQRRDLLIRIYTQNAIEAVEQESAKWDAIIQAAKDALQQYEQLLMANGITPGEAELAQIKAHNEQIAALEAEKNRSIEAINKRRRQQEQQAEKQATQAERIEFARRLQNIALWADAVSGFYQGLTANREVDLRIAEQLADADGVRTSAEIANLERLDQRRRRSALMQIAAQAASAVASAVSSALASPIPFPGNLLAAAPAVGTVLGLIAQARALLMERTDFTGGSNAAQGSGQGQGQQQLGFIPFGEKGGILEGPSHANNGLAVIDNNTGRQVAELEGGEPYMVLSKAFAQQNKDLLPALFRASREGTRFTPFDRDLVMPNPRSVQRAMQLMKMGLGGVVGTGGAVGADTLGGDRGGRDGFLERMEALLTANLKAMHQQRNAPMQIDVNAKVGLVDLERRKSEYEQIRGLARSRG